MIASELCFWCLRFALKPSRSRSTSFLSASVPPFVSNSQIWRPGWSLKLNSHGFSPEATLRRHIVSECCLTSRVACWIPLSYVCSCLRRQCGERKTSGNVIPGVQTCFHFWSFLIRRNLSFLEQLGETQKIWSPWSMVRCQVLIPSKDPGFSILSNVRIHFTKCEVREELYNMGSFSHHKFKQGASTWSTPLTSEIYHFRVPKNIHTKNNA